MLKNISLIPAALTLTGCITTQDFEASQARVETLASKVSALERNVMNLQMEMKVVKEQRPVRLPTGAPTTIKSQSTESVSSEQGDFDRALARYKSGDASGAIAAFEAYNSRYPNASKHNEVLYYLGHASYSTRNYDRAQQVLEELVYQNPINQIHPKAPSLLKQVYQAKGLSDKISELEGFMQNMNSVATDGATSLN